MIYSIRDLPATYTIQQELVLSFMSVWTASCEDKILGIYLTRDEAEATCKTHAWCVEELAA